MRSLAIVPAALVIGIAGERQTTNLLIFSQVVLSFQLPFAVVPLIQFTNDRRKMGEFANRPWVATLAWIVAVAITHTPTEPADARSWFRMNVPWSTCVLVSSGKSRRTCRTRTKKPHDFICT